MDRRKFLKSSIYATFLSGLQPACKWKPIKSVTSNKKVLVLGIDGMDPVLLEQFIRQGKMPNFRSLVEEGGFSELGTSTPPQSPVAWANFITSTNPGKHGIFDFIHRQPENFELYLSTSRTFEPTENKKLTIDKWVVPLERARVENLVQGEPFWNYLSDKGIKAVIYRVPSNFPPFAGKAKELSGMGTPDLLGTYGTFSYYTDNPPENSKDVTGGEVYPSFAHNGVVNCILHGPKNSFQLDPKEPYREIDGERRRNYASLEIPFKVFLDDKALSAVISIQGKEIFLKQGEWSDWVEVKFEVLPGLKSLYGIVRFYLKEVSPDFKLYVSPVNIHPVHQALPISNPPEYAKELYDELGFYYTQGIAEDTKARTYNILNEQEYLDQSQFWHGEQVLVFDWHLKRFKEGFLFFYFSALDLGQHMFFRYIDKAHPLYDPKMVSKMGNLILRIYQEMDYVLGMALSKMDSDTTLIIMSDHGFASFRRGFNLNSWLLENGYAYLLDPTKRLKTEYFDNLDWGRTRAYGLGINGLYLNLAGRENTGIVPVEKKRELLFELKRKLEAVVDPETGEKPIRSAYIAEEVYSGKFATSLAPDIVIGYSRGWRSSWDTALGRFPEKIFVDNLDPWSGDHCIDPNEVPGVVISNKKIKKKDPNLRDIGPTVLYEFGIKIPPSMEGEAIF